MTTIRTIDRNIWTQHGFTEAEIDIIERSLSEIEDGSALRSHADVMSSMADLRDQYLLQNA